MIVSVDDATRAAEDVLIALGIAPRAAALQAAQLVEGNLRGHPSHGLQRLAVLVAWIRAGLISNLDPVVTKVSSSVVDVDGRDCLGPVAADAAVEAAVAAARRSGIGLATVRNCGHLGMLASYVERIGGGEMIGIAITLSEALVHPIGGARALIGTNPIAICVPTSPEPFVLDMATGSVSMGQIIEYDRHDKPLEPGWAIDENGVPTTDAARARKGAITPFGGFKGFGLGLAFELMIGALTGSALGTDVHGTLDTEFRCNKGDLFLVIAPDQDRWAYMAPRLAAYLDEIRSSGVEGGGPVAIPGDRSRRLRDSGIEYGVEIAEDVWNEVVALGGALNGG